MNNVNNQATLSKLHATNLRIKRLQGKWLGSWLNSERLVIFLTVLLPAVIGTLAARDVAHNQKLVTSRSLQLTPSLLEKCEDDAYYGHNGLPEHYSRAGAKAYCELNSAEVASRYQTKAEEKFYTVWTFDSTRYLTGVGGPVLTYYMCLALTGAVFAFCYWAGQGKNPLTLLKRDYHTCLTAALAEYNQTFAQLNLEAGDEVAEQVLYDLMPKVKKHNPSLNHTVYVDYMYEYDRYTKTRSRLMEQREARSQQQISAAAK